MPVKGIKKNILQSCDSSLDNSAPRKQHLNTLNCKYANIQDRGMLESIVDHRIVLIVISRHGQGVSVSVIYIPLESNFVLNLFLYFFHDFVVDTVSIN